MSEAPSEHVWQAFVVTGSVGLDELNKAAQAAGKDASIRFACVFAQGRSALALLKRPRTTADVWGKRAKGQETRLIKCNDDSLSQLNTLLATGSRATVAGACAVGDEVFVIVSEAGPMQTGGSAGGGDIDDVSGGYR